MSDGSSAVSLTAVPAQAAASATAAYARIYKEQQPRLVAYARSLTRNAWAAEDLVAEAHFRVWRRLAAGHEIDNVPAYLMTTVRHLATAAGTAVRETPRDPHADEHVQVPAQGGDPAEQVSSVDMVVRVLGQLPERWVKALWLSEAEGQPLAAIAPQLGAKEGATAVLLHRAREGMRQAFLRAQTGAPDDPACQVHWARMPAYVRGAATARQSERLLGHVDACDDCRARLAALMSANDRLPALVGPALLVFAAGGLGKYLLTFAAGSAGAATVGGHAGVLLHGMRQSVAGGSKPVAVAAGAVVAGAAALCLVIGTGGPGTVPARRVPVADAPAPRVPAAGPPVGAPVAKSAPVRSAADDGTSGRADLADGGTRVLTDTAGTASDAGAEPPAAGGDTGGEQSDGSPAPDETTPAPAEPTESAPQPTDPAPPGTGGDDGKPSAPPTDDTPTPAPESPTPADPTPVDPAPTPGDTEPAPPTPPAQDPSPTPEDPGGGCPGHHPHGGTDGNQDRGDHQAGDDDRDGKDDRGGHGH
jgi:RNA polymerase sigma factor (sigma-70 family)